MLSFIRKKQQEDKAQEDLAKTRSDFTNMFEEFRTQTNGDIETWQSNQSSKNEELQSGITDPREHITLP